MATTLQSLEVALSQIDAKVSNVQSRLAKVEGLQIAADVGKLQALVETPPTK